MQTMARLTLVNATLITEGQLLPHQFLTLEDDTIAATGPMDAFVPERTDILDCHGQYLCPSYMDIHTHGAMMQDVMNGTREALDVISRFQYSHGVGTFLPTTLTAPLPEIEAVLRLVRTYHPPVPVSIPGVHLEGPFLSQINRGAQPEEYLLTPDEESLAFLRRNRDVIRLMTVSPDVNNILPLIRCCTELGIAVSGGHDAAIAPEIHAAKAAGMRGVTHIFCCSSTTSRRPGDAAKYPGLTELGLLDDDLYAEAIADNAHLPADLLRLIYRCKGPRNMCLVSDSISAAGMEPGHYLLGNRTSGVPVDVTEHVALVSGKNLFAGSITPVDRMVENAVAAGIPLAHAVAMVTENPARILGISQRGYLRPGAAAPLNLLDRKGALLGVIADSNSIHWRSCPWTEQEKCG